MPSYVAKQYFNNKHESYLYNQILSSSHFFALFEKSIFLREYHLLSCLPFKNV